MQEISRLSVLMPVYNEERTLRLILSRVLESPVNLEMEVICVDDGSHDDSWRVLEELAATEPRITVVRHALNRGKGAAIRTAIGKMTGQVAVVQDADLEYDPAELPRVLQPILDGRADAVFGSRFAASPERRVLFYWHSVGNKALTWLTNVLNDLNLTDMETCYKAVRADVLRNLRLQSERFGIEPEITTRLAQWGARIYEVPISYHGRGYIEGKNIGWRDGVQAILLLLKYRFVDTRFSDRSGHETLESMAVSKRVSQWTIAQFDSHLGDRVLEAGTGMGNLTRHLLRKSRLVGVDLDPFYAKSLDRRWGQFSNFEMIEGDLEDSGLYEKLGLAEFDSVLCVNVLEHLDHPDRSLDGFARVLRSGGKAILLVPAHQWLYSTVDRAIEHRTRYERADFEALIKASGLVVESMFEFNRFGVVGWLFNKATGSATIRKWQARAYSILLPLAKVVERMRFLPGLSLVAVARKP
ncbi:MAG TPA: glycosyltransferase [Acidimicrobiia bacterium]|nr:glycosyltransferase [Acidimicrobiia bacterium]